jgi:hypothetical protein
MTKFADCPACGNRFAKARSDARYCGRVCQSRSASERSNAARGQAAIRNQGSAGNVVALSAIKAVLPAVAPPPLDAEWLQCWPDLHRLVAGRMNRTRGSDSILRSEAVGNDRPPLGHALMLEGEWVGKVRRNGAVVWVSERFGSLDQAKLAVENHLSPVEVEAAANLNRPSPLALAA